MARQLARPQLKRGLRIAATAVVQSSPLTIISPTPGVSARQTLGFSIPAPRQGVGPGTGASVGVAGPGRAAGPAAGAGYFLECQLPPPGHRHARAGGCALPRRDTAAAVELSGRGRTAAVQRQLPPAGPPTGDGCGRLFRRADCDHGDSAVLIRSAGGSVTRHPVLPQIATPGFAAPGVSLPSACVFFGRSS